MIHIGAMGVSGEVSIKKEGEHTKVCPKCAHTSYPRLYPVAIASVTKGEKLLLATNKNSKTGIYSVLAGLCRGRGDLGRVRKTRKGEEVGIKVKNIRYFGSQTWPFPNSYIITFMAAYESGEIQINENGIADARWFQVDEIPDIPGNISISRWLIEWFIEKYLE